MVTSTAAYNLYKDDYLFWDGVVELTVATDRHSSEGGDKSDVVSYCKPTPMNKARRAFGEIQVQGSDTAFIIPDVLLVNILAASQVLRQGDKLTHSDGRVFIIQNVTRARFDTQWLVTCSQKRA